MRRRLNEAAAGFAVLIMVVGCASPVPPSSAPPTFVAPSPSVAPPPSATSARSDAPPEPSASASAVLELPRDNALLPLRADLTWAYAVSTTVIQTGPSGTLVNAIVGRERIGDEVAWQYEQGIGTNAPSRWILVNRGGDIWAIAIDDLHHGTWERRVLAVPQLFQPAPGERMWTAVYPRGFDDGGGEFEESDELVQARHGDVEVLGTSHPAWLITARRSYGGGLSQETTIVAEGVGVVDSTNHIDDGDTTVRLERLGVRPPAIDGTWRGVLDRFDIVIHFSDNAPSFLMSDNPQPSSAERWRIGRATVRFVVRNGPVRLEISTTLKPWGLVGTATDAAGRTTVVELIPDRHATR